jgi:hypothetical protein
MKKKKILPSSAKSKVDLFNNSYAKRFQTLLVAMGQDELIASREMGNLE